MITRIRIKHFKKFPDEEFELGSEIVLAGPNNSGKTTLLQAIATWRMCLDKWLLEKWPDPEKTLRAKTKPGVHISKKEFTAVP